MDMLLIVRHDVGKMYVVKGMSIAALAAVLAATFGVVAGRSTAVIASMGLVAFTTGILTSYVLGLSNNKLVRMFIEKIADEQRKLFPMYEERRAELTKRLDLLERDPLIVVEQVLQEQADELEDALRTTRGKHLSNFKTRHALQEQYDDLMAVNRCRRERLPLDEEMRKRAAAMKNVTLQSIQRIEAWEERSRVTLAEAERCLAKLT